MLHAFLWGLLWVAAVQTVPVLMNPTDTIGFDYEIAEFTEKQVIRFERRSNGNPWVDIGIPPIVAGGALPGWNLYNFTPGAPFDVVTTIEFRACNLSQCGPGSVPFTFMRIAGTSLPQPGSPLNVRRLPGIGTGP